MIQWRGFWLDTFTSQSTAVINPESTYLLGTNLGLNLFVVGLIVFCIGYLLGSINFSMIVGFFLKVNPTKMYSKNPGASNLGRIAGKKWGVIVGVLDGLKSVLAVFLASLVYRNFYFSQIPAQANHYWVVYISVFGTIVGHAYSLFLKFKGGKGIATFGGALFAISPFVGLIALLIWFGLIPLTRMISLSSLISIFVGSLLIFIPGLMQFYFQVEVQNFSSETGYTFTYQAYWLNIGLVFVILFLTMVVCYWKHRRNIVAIFEDNERLISLDIYAKFNLKKVKSA